MNGLKQGTPGFGLLTGAAFVAAGALVMWIGFWKTIILALLFAIGYFVGAVGNKGEVVRDAVDHVVPGRKEQKPIDFRAELEKEQESLFPRDDDQEQSSEAEKNEE